MNAFLSLGFFGLLLPYSLGCGVGLSASDYEMIENPVFTMKISPPVGWTHFPVKSADNNQVWFFVGQSNDTNTAEMRANAEITAAMMEALTAAQLPIYGVKVTDDYNPVSVENPYGKTTGVGPLYGKVEGGAVTQAAVGGATGDLVFSVYTITTDVTVNNLKTTRYILNIVKNTFMQKMSVNYNVKFQGELTIS